ncbi:hypothetical protein [Candidatus Nitrospira nitrosa]|nr:hypothetical protein [Candidatus Nitrospira nitrosa]
MATEIEIRKGGFLPFYSREFDSLTCNKILTAIERAVQSGARESGRNRAILWVENPRSLRQQCSIRISCALHDSGLDLNESRPQSLKPWSQSANQCGLAPV